MPVNESEINWYAVKVFFNKVFLMEDILKGMGLETYLAEEREKLEGAKYAAAAKSLGSDSRYLALGPVIYLRKPLVSSLIFVKAGKAEIAQVHGRLKQEADAGQALGFIYKTPDRGDFAPIPASQMESFRLVTMNGADGLEFFSDGDPYRFRQGKKVRVTGGHMKGAEGYIKRVRKNRRLLVCVEGVIAVATTYIPPELLETIQE